MSNDAPASSSVHNQTQTGLARRFADRFGSQFRYSFERRSWLFWDERRWAFDAGKFIESRMKETVRHLFVEAATAESKSALSEAVKFAMRMEKRAEQRSAIELARSEPNIPVSLDSLDAKPWLLNVRNGTLDLRSGELQPHDRNDLLTHLCEVEFDPEATAPRWTQFLEEVVPDSATRSFLQRAVGYSLTGDTREQVFFICHGSGSNGKSVFFETLMHLLGDLAVKCPHDTIVRDRATSIPNDVARLMGRRFAAAVELEEGFKLAESRIKELVSGERVSSRHMKGEWFDFVPAFKLWIASNYRPRIRGTDYGIWRRICLIPFEVTIENPDRKLLSKLRRESPGILRWALDGCLQWQETGLEIPEHLTLARDRYRSSEDVLGRFLEEECELERNATVSKSELYRLLERWCRESGEDTPGKRKLGARLLDMGIHESRTSRTRSWVGIRPRGAAS